MSNRHERYKLLQRTLFVLALVVVAGGVVVALDVSIRPRLVLQTATCDFGSVPQGEDRKAVVKFRNRGLTELRIEQVRATCTCDGTIVGAQDIPPLGAGLLGEGQ